MTERTNGISRKAKGEGRLDAVDRKILGILARDATKSYAEMGKLLNLSAPAIHERVKRLKSDGVIKGTVAVLDGAAVGRPLLAFVHIDAHTWQDTQRLLDLKKLPEVEEIHTVAGDTALILKVRTQDTHSLEVLLSQIYAMEGLRNSRSYIVLTTYLERMTVP